MSHYLKGSSAPSVSPAARAHLFTQQRKGTAQPGGEEEGRIRKQILKARAMSELNCVSWLLWCMACSFVDSELSDSVWAGAGGNLVKLDVR